MNTYVGLDYSMTSPGLCIYQGKPKDFSFKKSQLYSLSDHNVDDFQNIQFYKHQPFDNQIQRFDNIAAWVLNIIGDFNVDDLVFGLEGYSMGSRGKVFNIGECTGILKHQLWLNGIEPYIFAPTEVKKWATGKGNSNKDSMAVQFAKDTGLDLKHLIQPKRKLGSPTTDIIDAYYICGLTIQNS